jgi:N,N'-diacetyllegionaminate synthase
MQPITIGNHTVGPGNPCFIVAEIGLNHNGDMDLAGQTIRAAAESGADAVKFQNYRTEDFISNRSLTYEYISEGKTVIEPQYDMFKRCELSLKMLRELKACCDDCGIVFHSTPTGEDSIRDLVEVGAPMLKNGSDYLTNLSLIRAMGESGLPTVLSTGMANLAEVDEAVRAFRETGNEELILLHCTSSYPTPSEDVNLRRIPVLGDAFECLSGFSDHTAGVTAAIGSVVLGACLIEKHFTFDKKQPGPDHRFSSDPAELKELVEAVRTIEENLGNSRIGPTPSEALGRRDFRLSCVTRRALPAGHTIQNDDLAFRRPGTGIPPAHAYLLAGRKLKQDVPAGKIIELEDLGD